MPTVEHAPVKLRVKEGRDPWREPRLAKMSELRRDEDEQV
jgi:hypothetical protein